MIKAKIFLSFLVIYSLVMATACPSRVTLEQAKAESSRIAIYTFETTNAVRDLFRAKVITPEQTVAISDKLILLSKGGQAFDALIKRYEETYRKVENVPRAEWAKALELFNGEVVDRLIAVLLELKVIQSSERVRQVISLLITSVRIIARAFSIETPVVARVREAQV
jgi:hypothetical protein